MRRSSNRSDVVGELLLDTAAVVSLLDRSQKRHQAFARFFVELDGPVVSTEAVLTEAGELGTDLVLTTDRRDFAVYRIRGRRHFDIVPVS